MMRLLGGGAAYALYAPLYYAPDEIQNIIVLPLMKIGDRRQNYYLFSFIRYSPPLLSVPRAELFLEAEFF